MKYEPLIFVLFVLLNTIPIIASKYFVTVDGPSHLNNATIITNLLFGNDSAIHAAFRLNPEPVPNWTAHLLLAFFRLIVPSWLAEKFFLLLYVIGLPYAFRFMLRSVGIKTPFISLLILPFAYNFLLLMGFFNFAIAFLPLFILLGIYFKTGEHITRKKFLLLFIWSAILYFSHIYVFAAGITVIGLHALSIIFKNKTTRFSFALKYCGVLFLLMLPFLLLFLVFIFRQPTITSNAPEVGLDQRFIMLKQMQCLSMYGFGLPTPFTTTIGIGFLFLLLTGIIYRIKIFIQKKMTLFRLGDCWLLASAIFLILFFSLSDQTGGGMNCYRLLHLFFVCIIAWTALNNPSPFITMPILILVLFAQAKLISIYTPLNKGFSDEAAEWSEAGKIPEKNSITIPIIFNAMWLDYHCSGYFGASDSRMIANNYEAGLQWFPIIFNRYLIVKLEGQKEDNALVGYDAFVKDSIPILKKADYVVIWQQPTTKNDSTLFHPIDSLLKINYSLSYFSKNIHLFKRNK